MADKEPDILDEVGRPEGEVEQTHTEMVQTWMDENGIHQGPLEKKLLGTLGIVLFLCFVVIMIGIAARVLAWGLGPWLG